MTKWISDNAGAIAIGLVVVAVGFTLLSGDSGSSDKASSAPSGPGIEQRAQNVLEAAGYWEDYGITDVKEVGVDGLFVETALDPNMDLEANDICFLLSSSFDSLVLVQVYDQDGNEIDAESCGNVT